jgi:uncharacterized protein YqgC (DUF456 family)
LALRASGKVCAMTEGEILLTVLCGAAILIGTLGVIVPILPGLLLSWAGVLTWAIFADRSWGRWVVLAAASIVALSGLVAKYVLPGRNLKRNGVPNRTLFFGGVLGIIGFFVVPVVGLLLGFVLGVYLSERLRLHSHAQAWPSTKHALKAAGLSILIELAAALCIAGIWIAGLIAT